MPRECAFCRSTAKLTGEHLWSDWMNRLFPGNKRFAMMDTAMAAPRDWGGPDLDLKAHVVCGSCNNGWMSQIEATCAPMLTPLIEGKLDVPIPQSSAESIATFAFKTAVIFDHMRRDARPFFPRETRYRFKALLEIPVNVQMWFAGFLRRGDGAAFTAYNNLPGPRSVQLYICTYCVGHFVFQLVAFRKKYTWHLRPHETAFENLAVPFWPRIPNNFIWPPATVLMDAPNLRRFENRWRIVDLLQITGY